MWHRHVVLAGLVTAIAMLPNLAMAQTGSLDVVIPYPGISVDAGATASFTIGLESSVSQKVELSTEGLPSGWTATFKGGGAVINSVTVDPDTPPEVRLDVTVPAGAKDGAYPITVRAGSATVQAVEEIVVTVAGGASGSVTLTSDFPGLRGDASSSFNFNVTVQNDTAADVTLELKAEGPTGWRVEAKPAAQSQAASIIVPSGGSEKITVTAKPPIDVEADLYQVTVKATGDGVEAEIPLGIQITGQVDLTVTTPDQRLNTEVTAGEPSQLPLVVMNTGTARLVGVQLTATPPRDWKVEFEPAVIEQLAPGEVANITATITPSADAIAGDYSLGVRASVDQAQSSIDVRATVNPSPLWGLVGVGVIALTLGGLSYVFRRFGRR